MKIKNKNKKNGSILNSINIYANIKHNQQKFPSGNWQNFQETTFFT